MEEKIIRKVTRIGNGAHIFAPKEWINEEVIIIRMPAKKPKEEIFKLLSPHLDKIIAVFLYGSYARNEQNSDSDMDVFILASEKFSVNSKEIEAIVVPEDKIESAIKLNPVLFYSMIREAKPIINSSYLEKLKKEKINFSYFKDFLSDTKRLIQINKTEIELAQEDKFSPAGVIYSLILRLRGLFIISLLSSKENYSKIKFREFLEKNSKIDYGKIYEIYCSVRDGKKTEIKVPISQAESLLIFLAKETEKLRKKLK
jgi:predicted nucleotidyltransferase